MDIDELAELKQQEPQKLHISLPADLHRRLKVAAAQKGESMTAVIIEAVENWLYDWSVIND